MKLINKIVLVVTDIFLICASFFLSLVIRYEGVVSLKYIQGRDWFYVLSIISIIIIFQLMGMYKKVWRYAGVHELLTVVEAVTLSAIPTIFAVMLKGGDLFPRSAIIIFWLINLIFIGGIRFILRLISEIRQTPRVTYQKRTLIVGADDAGEIILRELQRHSFLGYQPVGFVDEDRHKRDYKIHGVPVLGIIDEISSIIDHLKIDEIIITHPSASKVRKIIELTDKKFVKLKTIPSLPEIIDGNIKVSQIREVKIEDILDRQEVRLDIESIAKYLSGKTILVTGAGGSIGSEISRQIVKFKPKKLILLGKGENSIQTILIELIKYNEIEIISFIGDIRDGVRMEKLFSKYNPDIIFHAAAHKHVDLMELNPTEAVSNNILGTLNLIELSLKYRSESFVLLSIDKAVEPVSVMGYTKKVSEMLLKSYNNKGGTKFIAVRFGNVLDSKGSVIPIFRKQILNGGPVTVTDPEMMRFFMTIPEASQLVIQAAAIGKGGEIFILDMGKPIKIIDIAKNMIRLSGFEPEIDIPIKISGIRPGEKLIEELINNDEEKINTKIEKIFQVVGKDSKIRKIEEEIDVLKNMVNKQYDEGIKPELIKIVQ